MNFVERLIHEEFEFFMRSALSDGWQDSSL